MLGHENKAVRTLSLPLEQSLLQDRLLPDAGDHEGHEDELGLNLGRGSMLTMLWGSKGFHSPFLKTEPPWVSISWKRLNFWNFLSGCVRNTVSELANV